MSSTEIGSKMSQKGLAASVQRPKKAQKRLKKGPGGGGKQRERKKSKTHFNNGAPQAGSALAGANFLATTCYISRCGEPVR